MHCQSNTGGIAYSNAYFGRGSGGIFLNYVGCTGTESSLFSCTNAGIGVHNCRHSYDVGVRCLGKVAISTVSELLKAVHKWICWFILVPANCTDGEIRLKGGSTLNEGRVEICIDRVWGTICYHLWDKYEAQVVCRQLGYSTFGEYTLPSG